MSVNAAQIHYCDRCGASHICLAVFRYYDPLPAEWLNIDNYGELCPSCAREFRKFATDFLGDKVPKQWDARNFLLKEMNYNGKANDNQ